MTPEEIQGLLAKSDPELLAELGRTQTKGAFGADPDQLGREIYRNIVTNVAALVCSDPQIKALYERSNPSKIALVSAVIDCISAYIVGVSVGTVAVLLVRGGIGKLCREEWSAQ